MAAKTRFTQFWFPGRAYIAFTAKTTALGLNLKLPRIDSLQDLGDINSLQDKGKIEWLQ